MTDTSPPADVQPTGGPQPPHPTELGVRLRLVGDGTPHGTRVETEDGTPVRGVTSVLVQCIAGEPATRAILHVTAVGFDTLVEAQAVRTDRRPV